MITKSNYLLYIDSAYKQIANLPTGEIKYYLYLLTTSIKNKNNNKMHLFLNSFLTLIESVAELHQVSNRDFELDQVFDKIREQFVDLAKIAEVHNFGYRMKTHLLHAGGATCALMFGIMGGVIGGTAGLARGVVNLNPLKGTGVGIFAGVLMGAVIGFRLPKKLFKNEAKRQLGFGLNGIDGCFQEMQKENPNSSFFSSKVKSIKNYQRKMLVEIKALFEDEDEFNKFLNTTIEYEISTLLATFIDDPMLEGYLGHHSYIKITIKNTVYLIEFAPEPSDLSKGGVQSEKRYVGGKLLIDMLAFHRKLQEAHSFKAVHYLAKAKPGDRDCFSYVNQVLIGTNQEATHLTRFANLTPIGTAYVKCINWLSPFESGFFHEKDRTPENTIIENEHSPLLNVQ